MRSLIPLALLLAAGFGCDIFTELDCDVDPEIGPYDQVALPGYGTTLEPWVRELSEDGVELNSTWDDDAPIGFWAALHTFEPLAELRENGNCWQPMVVLDGEATVGNWEEGFLIAGRAQVVHWEIEGQPTYSLSVETHDIMLPPDRAPFDGWELVEDLEWKLEIFQVRGWSYAYMEWVTHTGDPVLWDGTRRNRGRILYTEGHPWTHPQQP